MKKDKMPKKERIDTILVQQGYFETKSQAQAAILAGNVRVNNETITKAGTKFPFNTELNIEIKVMPYVSRGGFKLKKAIDFFNINVKDRICLDIGASTGGFTDCLLQNKAKKVYAIDVGYGQLAWKLRNNPNVVVVERTNIKKAEFKDIYKDIKEKKQDILASLAVIDVSFISLIKILKNIIDLMNKNNTEIIALIKPQFEAGRELVPKDGVIKDKNVHFSVIKSIMKFAAELNLFVKNLEFSPIKGPAGNIEYLIHLGLNEENIITEKDINKIVDNANECLKTN